MTGRGAVGGEVLEDCPGGGAGRWCSEMKGEVLQGYPCRIRRGWGVGDYLDTDTRLIRGLSWFLRQAVFDDRVRWM